VEEESPARTVQADTSFSEKSGGEETGASSESQRLSVKKDAAPAKARGRPRKAAAQGAPACDTSLKTKSKKENRGKSGLPIQDEKTLTAGYLDLVDVPSL
jgi:hypothetical protein